MKIVRSDVGEGPAGLEVGRIVDDGQPGAADHVEGEQVLERIRLNIMVQ